jgi:hypothetical protein
MAVALNLPEWVVHLSSGIPLPPEPHDGWSRWWDDNADLIWLVLIAGAIGLAFNLLHIAVERIAVAI